MLLLEGPSEEGMLATVLDESVTVVDSNELLGWLRVVVSESAVLTSDEVPDEVAIVLMLGTVADVCEELAPVSEELNETDPEDSEFTVMLEDTSLDNGGSEPESDVPEGCVEKLILLSELPNLLDVMVVVSDEVTGELESETLSVV